MLKEAYSTKELSEIFGVAPKSIHQQAVRENWRNEIRQRRGGGKMWLVSSMPESTRLAIRVAEERKAVAICENIIAPQELHAHAVTKAVSDAVFDDKRRLKALAKADLVKLYIDWLRRHGASETQKKVFLAAYFSGMWPELLKTIGRSVSWKSIERWKLQVREKDNVLALADKRGIARKGRTQLTDRHTVLILGQVLNPNAPDIAACARRIQARCKAEGIFVPSDRTIRRYVERYTAECFDEWTLWREGKKAWNDKCAISLLRDWSQIEVGDIVIGDGHTLNFETLDPETGKAKRMTLLLFFDGASNHPLGWEIMASENIACISAAFRRTCLILGKFPRVVYLDNGKAFRAKFFKGTADLQQAGISGLYSTLGCEVIHAWPYHGQSKPIERFFGTFHELEVFIPSYTGNSIARKPPRMRRGETMHRELHEKMGCRPLTLEETHMVIAHWFDEYAQRPQFRTHLSGKTPAEVFRPAVGPGVDPVRLALLMMQKTIKTITKDGIRHQGKLFWHEALSGRRHPVVIRYDELFHPYTVLVYTQDGDFICEARDRHHFQIAAGLHPAARVLGTAEQQQALVEAVDLKKGQERVAGASMRYMLETVVLPETQKMLGSMLALPPKEERLSLRAPEPDEATVTPEEAADIEAMHERFRAESDTNLPAKPAYLPAHEQRFKDSLAKYDYLFHVRYSDGHELVPQDRTWMDAFEQTPEFTKRCKRRYDGMREVIEMQQLQLRAS